MRDVIHTFLVLLILILLVIFDQNVGFEHLWDSVTSLFKSASYYLVDVFP